MDANKDGYAWMWTKVSSGDRVMGHQASSTAASDDWLISYYMPFEKDATYRAEMELHAYSADKLEFALLDEMYTVKPAQVLDTVTIKGNRDKQRIGVVFKAESDGYKNLGIHALSPMRADWLEVFNLSVKKAEKSNLAAVSISGPEKPMGKKESVYTVRVENRGTDKAYAYRVTLVDKNGEELNHKDVAVTLNSVLSQLLLLAQARRLPTVRWIRILQIWLVTQPPRTAMWTWLLLPEHTRVLSHRQTVQA